MKTNTKLIWEEFSNQLQKYILKRVNNFDDAEDILQDVFIKIHLNKNSIVESEKLVGWIYAITRNSIIDYYKQKNRNTKEEELNENKIFQTDDFKNSSYLELKNCLNPFLVNLSQEEKHLVVSADIKLQPQIELAEELGIPYPTLKSKLQRVRKKIKKMFFDCCKFEVDSKGKVIEFSSKNKVCKSCG
ncbi:MAG: RNA polymerase sigma factor SigZ [Melioribacteraceae bacterium]